MKGWNIHITPKIALEYSKDYAYDHLRSLDHSIYLQPGKPPFLDHFPGKTREFP